MNILITAGNTQVAIDKVRCLTNIFTGRTGAAIALEGHRRGHHIALLTSHPEALAGLPSSGDLDRSSRSTLFRYRTFEDLENLLTDKVTKSGLEAVIHCAAVSDYRAAGIYAPAPGTSFDPGSGTWKPAQPALVDCAAGKVKSDHEELWLRLVRTPKLVDRIRKDWHFQGLLVKFKLEVAVAEEQLRDIAERSRVHSEADLMVANTLEGMAAWALLGPIDGSYHSISRRELPGRLFDALEKLHKEKTHG